MTNTSSNPVSQAPSWRTVLKIHPAAELFPRLSSDELRALANDIKAHGIQTEIVVLDDPDEGESLLDGISRLDAAELAGVLTINQDGKVIVPDCDNRRVPVSKRYIEPSDGIDPYALVLSLNIHRRHIRTPEQRDDLILKVLQAQPEKPDRQIARDTKTSPTKVGKLRKKAETTGLVSTVDTRVDKRGARRAAHKASETPKSAVGNDVDPAASAEATMGVHAAAEAAAGELAPVAPPAASDGIPAFLNRRPPEPKVVAKPFRTASELRAILDEASATALTEALASRGFHWFRTVMPSGWQEQRYHLT
jgi:DNA-binding Lrp family transcriptional regulator